MNLTEEQNLDLKNDNLQFLTFKIADEEYAVKITLVREIKVWSETTKLPNSPDYLLGVVNLRGMIVPIFDLKKKFNLGYTEIDSNKVIIVLTFEERTIGIIVDAVSDIINVDSKQLKTTIDSELKIKDEFVDNLILHNDRMVIVLNINKLLTEDY